MDIEAVVAVDWIDFIRQNLGGPNDEDLDELIEKNMDMFEKML